MEDAKQKPTAAVSRIVVAVIVIIIIVVAAAAIGFSGMMSKTAASSTSTSIITSSSSSVSTELSSSISPPSNSASNSAASSTPLNSSQLTVIENEPPNTIDPAGGFFAGEDDVMTNVWQGLVTFNYTSINEIAPILGLNWSSSANYSSYTFYLRQDAYFMNGDPFNASVVWFSIYRTILMNQIGASFFTNLLYNGTTALASGYNVPGGVLEALQSAGYQFSATNATLAQEQAAFDLASILSNFSSSNSTIQKIMSYPNQAIVVSGTFEVQFNLVNPYSDFVQVLAAPNADQIDPSFVDANGGVQPNSANTYVNTHSMGTGPYYVKSYVEGNVLTLQENPNYWAAKLPQNESNIMLTTPHIPVIVIEYTTESSQIILGIESNNAALVEGPPEPALTPNYLASIATAPGVEVMSLPNAAKFLYLMIVLDTEKYPYNITSVRQAIADSVNYSEILDSVSGPYGQAYVGPISPGLPYYNPANLPPYSYQPANAIKILSGLGFALSLPNGSTINPGGRTFSPTFTYVSTDAAEVKIAEEVQAMFSDVGLQLKLNPVTTQTLENSISQSGTASTYPEMLLYYWYPSWLDPVYQDLVLQVNIQYGGIAGDEAWFNNTMVNNITNSLPFLTNATLANESVAQVYQTVYQQVPYIWLYAIVPYWVQRTYVTGVIYNPGILGYYYALIQYKSSGS